MHRGLWCLNKKHMRKIAQIDPKNGDIIKVYKSIVDAEKQTGIKTIEKCLRFEQNTSGGYIWYYHSANLENSEKLRHFLLV
jgi:hypothetical protein